MKKTDKFIPVITMVVYYGEKALQREKLNISLQKAQEYLTMYGKTFTN